MEPRAALAQYMSRPTGELTLWVDQPEPAHRPLPALARHRHPRAQDPRDRAGGGRRLRQQDPALPRRRRWRSSRRRCSDARSSGPRPAARTTRPPSTAAITCRTSRWPRRSDGTITGAARAAVGQPGRVSLDRVHRHPDHPARPDAVGRLQRSRTSTRTSTAIFTNTTPVDAYRGAGRPEATFMRRAAGRPGRVADRQMDPGRSPAAEPASRRSTNGHMSSHRPHATTAATTRARSTRRCRSSTTAKPAQRAGATCAAQGQSRRHRRRARTPRSAASGPRRWLARSGFGGGLWESAIVRFHPSGKVNVMVGASPHGQGEETTFAQIVADELGVDVDDVDDRPRRHRADADGLGHLRQPHDARSAARALMGGDRKIRDKAKIARRPPARGGGRRTSSTRTASSS